MEFTVYRQSIKERPDGQLIYKGEDARPFVGKNLLMVADGMGGAAAIRHQNFNRDLFDQDKLLDVLFHDVFEDYSADFFQKYVIDSFYEFLSIKGCYFDNINNNKKSGYFASRLVSAIVLYDILIGSKDAYENGAFFKKYNESDENEKAKLLQEIGDYYATYIQKKLQAVATNAGFTYESSLSGLALLGTTLCATIFNEVEDGVEALYLVAGDSRPYMWNETGLYQVVEDQEGADGGMTNYIKANEGATFDVVCNYRKFSKPCILFNASDGCFDSKYFPNQMAFEKLLLDNIVSSNSIEEAGKKIEEIFVEYGRHDDSSTIALKVFGFIDYEQLKQAAQNRLTAIAELYTNQLPELFERDFSEEYKAIQENLPAQIIELQSCIEGIESVTSYCREEVVKGGCPAYNVQLSEINSKIAEYDRTDKQLSSAIGTIIEKYFILFVDNMFEKDKSIDRRSVEKLDAIRREYDEEVIRYKNTVASLKGYLPGLFDDLSKALGIAESFDSPWDYSSVSTIDCVAISDAKKKANTIFSFIEDIASKKNEIVHHIVQLRSLYYEKNRKAAKGQEKIIETMIQFLSTKLYDAKRFGLFDYDEEELDQKLNLLKDVSAKIRELENIEKVKIREQAIPTYRKEHCLEIIQVINSGVIGPVPEDVRTKIHTFLETMHEKQEKLGVLASRQQELFEKYDEIYYSLIRRKDQ